MEKKFDRSKFVAAKLSTVKETQKEAKKHESRFGNLVSFHSVEDGANIFRIAPAHNLEDSPYIPMRSTLLRCKVDEYENGEKTGNKIVKLKKIFIATQHSGLNELGKSNIDKDPVEVYIKFVEEIANEKYSDSKSEKIKFLNPIKGYRKGKQWVSGINPSSKFVCYAWNEEGTLGRLELNSAWMKKMIKISLQESEDNSALIDIFSDPDEGYPLNIFKGKKENGAGVEYLISAEKIKRGESWDDFFKRVRITDEQLIELNEKKSLKELFYNSYTERDFNLAIDGLKRFDDENGYNVFSNEEFLDILEEISELVPSDPKREIEDIKEGKDIEENFKNHVKSKENDLKEEDKPKEEKVIPLEKKRFLRKYIFENYGEEFSLPTLKKKELDKWYKLALLEDELPFKEIKEEEKEIKKEVDEEDDSNKKIKEEKKEEIEPEEVTDEVNDYLAQLRKLRGKN